MYMELEPILRCGERLKRETERLYDLYEKLHRITLELQEDGGSGDVLRVPEQNLLEVCTEFMKIYAGLEKIRNLYWQTEQHLARFFQGEEPSISMKKIEQPVWKELIESEKIQRILALRQEGGEKNESGVGTDGKTSRYTERTAEVMGEGAIRVERRNSETNAPGNDRKKH